MRAFESFVDEFVEFIAGLPAWLAFAVVLEGALAVGLVLRVILTLAMSMPGF